MLNTRFALFVLLTTIPSLSHGALSAPVGSARTPEVARAAVSFPSFPSSESPLSSLSDAWTEASVVFDGLKAFKGTPALTPVRILSSIHRPSLSRPGRSISDLKGWDNEEGFIPAAPPDLPGRTPLEKHAAFFDINGDGVITVLETRRRLRQLGLGRVRASALAAGIHAGLAYPTSESWRDVVLMRIQVKNIHKGIHAGDTGIYDKNGEFVPEQFQRMFSSFAKRSPGRLNETEFFEMIAANAERRPGLLGKFAAEQEFGLLLEIGADGTEVIDGKTLRTISRERLRRFYDGTLLYELVGETP